MRKSRAPSQQFPLVPKEDIGKYNIVNKCIGLTIVS